MAEMNLNIKFAAETLQKLSGGFRRGFGEIERSLVKGETSAKLAADMEQEIAQTVKMLFERAGKDVVISPKTMDDLPDYGWVVTPICGKSNLRKGRPEVCVVATFIKAGETAYGVAHFPILDKTAIAEKAHGASFLNRLRVSGTDELKGAVIALGSEHGETRLHDIAGKIIAKGSELRTTGCSVVDFADVASGRADALVSTPEDIASLLLGELMVREAGGFISDGLAKPVTLDSRFIFAGNSKIHKVMLKDLK